MIDESGRSWRSAGMGPGARNAVKMKPFLKHPIHTTGRTAYSPIKRLTWIHHRSPDILVARYP